MNYCTIEDAWGANNFATKQFQDYIEKDDSIQHNNKKSKELCYDNNEELKTMKQVTKIYDTSNKMNEINDCESFIQHIKSCRKCNNRVREQFSPKIVEKFQCMIDDNRDTIVLILIGISILLFFNLIINVTKN